MILHLLRNLLISMYDKTLIPSCLIPKKYEMRLRAKRIFLHKTLEHDARGFWHVNPMPRQDELSCYYKNTYWQHLGKVEGVFERDIDHYLLLRKIIPDFFSAKRTFLNFGAGHGGLSHLLWLENHRVINVEPSNLTLNYPENWMVYQNIDQVNERVDLIYGSHSLEHVQDIDRFEYMVQKILKSDGYVFWEVPNADVDLNGGCNGKIHPPHTYYFTKKYFETSGYTCILNSTFKQGSFPLVQLGDNSGEVIRYLGKKII